MDEARNGFAEVYGAGYPRLVGQLTLMTGSRAAAEDVAQDAYARAWIRWSQVARYDDPQGWVRRVAFNLAVSRFRRARVALQRQSRLLDGSTPPEPSPDWLDLRDRLRALPAAQRRALILTVVAGLSAEEAAVEMGVKPATVRSWLHRGRRAVRAAEAEVTGTADIAPTVVASAETAGVTEQRGSER